MISVVIPALNEEEGIAGVIQHLKNVLSQLCAEQYEIIVVDDGSTDSTSQVAEQNGAKVIKHPINIGYGNALKTGILHAQYDAICITDADGTYPIDEIPNLWETYQKGFDMVVGARTGVHYRESVLKNPARIVFNWLAEYVAGRQIPDINSGLRIFKRDNVIPFLNDLCGTFSFTTSMTLIFFRQSFFVTYLPISYHQRKGESKVKIVRDTLRSGQILIETILTYNPLKLFLLISSIYKILGVLFLIAYFILNYRWEWFIACLFMFLLSGLSTLIGCLSFVSNQRVSDVWHLRYPEAE